MSSEHCTGSQMRERGRGRGRGARTGSRGGGGGRVIVTEDVDENDSSSLGEEVLSGPSEGMLAPFVLVYGHRHQPVHRPFLQPSTGAPPFAVAMAVPHSPLLLLYLSLSRMFRPTTIPTRTTTNPPPRPPPPPFKPFPTFIAYPERDRDQREPDLILTELPVTLRN